MGDQNFLVSPPPRQLRQTVGGGEGGRETGVSNAPPSAVALLSCLAPNPKVPGPLTLGARNWEDLFTTHLGKEPGKVGKMVRGGQRETSAPTKPLSALESAACV